jgi:uncharacterized repeat protein (TIGR01451 family)
LTLSVSGPQQVPLGQPLAFEVVVEGPGQGGPVAGVQVELPLPPGVRLLRSEPAAEARTDRLTWSLGNLEAGARRRIAVELQPADAGQVLLSPVARFEAAAGLVAQVVRPPFGLTVTGPDTATPGEKVVWQIQLANNRTTPIQKIVLRDRLPPGLQHPQGKEVEADIASLAPGEVKTIRLEVQAVAPGRHVNEVIAWADGGLTASAQAAVQVTEQSLALSLEGPRRAALNGELDFRLELRNPGRGPAVDVRLAQVVPDGLEFVRASSGGAYNPANHAIVWSLGTVASSQMVTFKLRARLPGDWALPAAAQGSGTAVARATHAVHLEAVPTLALELNAHDGPLDANAEAVYEMRVVNQGAVPASGLSLVVEVPDGLVPLQGDGPTAARVQGQQVTFDALAQLAPRADAVYHVRVRGERAGQGRFRARLYAGGLEQPLVQEVTAQVRGAASAPKLAPLAPN